MLTFAMQKMAAQSPCGMGIVPGSSFTDLPAGLIRPFCNANGFSVTTSINHDEFCTSGGDVYIILEARLKGSPDSRFGSAVTGNTATYFSDIVYAPGASSPSLTAIHLLTNGNAKGIAFRFRISLPPTVTTDTFTFPFSFAPNFFFGDVPWTIYTATSPPDTTGAPIVPPLPPGSDFFEDKAGALLFEAPYFPIVGSQNISTFDNLLRQSWADNTLLGMAHSIMLLPGAGTANPVLTIDVPQFVQGFTNPNDRGKLYLCPGGQVKVAAGSEYILTLSDAFSCTQVSKGIRVENGGKVWLSSSTFDDAEVAVDAKRGSIVQSFFTTYTNNYIGMRLDNSGGNGPDLQLWSTLFSTFRNTGPIKPAYPGMANPGTTKGYGMEVKYHPGIWPQQVNFEGLNNGLLLLHSSANINNLFFKNIQPDASSPNQRHGWAVYGFGSGVETLDADQQLANAGALIESCDKGIFAFDMNVNLKGKSIGMNSTGGLAPVNLAVQLINCRQNKIVIDNCPIRAREYGIRASSCVPLLTGSKINNNNIKVAHPTNSQATFGGILLNENIKVTGQNMVGWKVTNNPIELNRANWGVRYLGSDKAEFRSNTVTWESNPGYGLYTGFDFLNTSKIDATCNMVKSDANVIGNYGYKINNVSQSSYTCNDAGDANIGYEFSTMCDGTDFKGNDVFSIINGLFLKKDVALGTQGLDYFDNNNNLIRVQDHGNKWVGVSGAFHETTLAPVVQLSRFGVDPAENPQFEPNSNWGSTWFWNEPTPTISSFSCAGFTCIPPGISPERDRFLEKSIADGSIHTSGLPGVIPIMLENHLYAQLQEAPVWGNEYLYQQFLQSKVGSSTALFWQIRQNTDALNARMDQEQTAVETEETEIRYLRSMLYQMDSIRSGAGTVNPVYYQQTLAQLAAKTENLRTILANIRVSRLTTANQLLTQNAAVPVTQNWEKTEKAANELYIRLFLQDSLNAAQLATADSLGSLCVHTHGEAVLWAQVLYNLYEPKEYLNGCPQQRGDRSQEVPQILAAYPNPSTGLVSIIGEGVSDCAVHVFDMTGQKIVSLALTGNSLDLGQLSSGVYFLRLTNPNGGLAGNAKIIICK